MTRVMERPAAGEPGSSQPLRDGEERRTAEILRIGEERLQLALDASGLIGVWDWDIGRDIVVTDARLAGFYGVDPLRAAVGVPAVELTTAVHPADRDRLWAAIRQALATGDELAVEYRLVSGDGAVRWVFARGRILRDDAGAPSRLLGAVVDITARKREEERQRLLVELGDRVRDLADTAAIAGAAAEILGRALGVSRAGYARIEAEATAHIESDWADGSVASVVGSHRLADFGDLRRSLKRGDVLAVVDVAEDPRTRAGSESFAALSICGLLNVPLIVAGRLAALIFLHDTRPRQWANDEIAFVRDFAERTWAYAERARAEAHQRLLAHELQHRVKNTLAMVQAIVNQSLRSSSSLDDARKTITDRLKVLAKAHDNLMGPDHASAPIAEVVAGAVSVGAGESGRVRLAGPPIDLGAKPALALSIALHELCTNAVKYGALSNEAGHVEVSWLIAEQPDGALFHLAWSEHGGPPVATPTRRGFGSRLIESGIAADLRGDARLDFEAKGITWSLSAPLAAIQS